MYALLLPYLSASTYWYVKHSVLSSSSILLATCQVACEVRNSVAFELTGSGFMSIEYFYSKGNRCTDINFIVTEVKIIFEDKSKYIYVTGIKRH